MWHIYFEVNSDDYLKMFSKFIQSIKSDTLDYNKGRFFPVFFCQKKSLVPKRRKKTNCRPMARDRSSSATVRMVNIKIGICATDTVKDIIKTRMMNGISILQFPRQAPVVASGLTLTSPPLLLDWNSLAMQEQSEKLALRFAKEFWAKRLHPASESI